MVNMFRAALALAATTLVSPPAAAASAHDAAIERATKRGAEMYQFDRAAWVTSDDIQARLPVARAIEVGGWIVTGSNTHHHVDYFGKGAAADRIVYSADESNGTVSNPTVYPVSGEPMLQEPALRMAHALHAAWDEMARHADWQPCTNAHFNTIVLPPDADGTIPVYFLTPQTQADSFPLGGHFEVDVGADGRIKFTRGFTKTCITLTKPPLSGGATSAAMFVTHLLDARPTEVHVFEQYYAGVPLIVSIADPKSLWAVNNGLITDVTSSMKP